MDGPEATRRLQALDRATARARPHDLRRRRRALGRADRRGSGLRAQGQPGRGCSITAVRAVAAGGAWLDPRVLPRVLARATRSGRRPSPTATRALEQLTPRELEVLRRICRGATNGEIATAAARGGAHREVARVGDLLKLGARDRAAAIIAAYDAGLRDLRRFVTALRASLSAHATPQPDERRRTSPGAGRSGSSGRPPGRPGCPRRRRGRRRGRRPDRCR